MESQKIPDINSLLDSEWDNFINDNCVLGNNYDDTNESLEIPKASDIYISTKTMITYLNTTVDLTNVFWKLPMIKYYETKNGIIKKQIKLTNFNKDDVSKVNELVKQEDICQQDIINVIDNAKLKVPYKHVQKINIGVSKKELTSYRSKTKGAFYNCFALILRIKYKDEFKEVHVKVFNTGKLEIPGIQNNELLYLTLNELVNILEPVVGKKITYNKDTFETVLINSNFNCGFYINRNKLHQLLKFKYNMISMFDPCSYPGIQTKFYYNEQNMIQDGICRCKQKCSGSGNGKGDGNCIGVSFMIFRTGSILIVGHCDEDILHIIYNYLIKLFNAEFKEINEGIITETPVKKVVKKIKRQTLIFDKK
jgi:hypothetical protein